MDSGRTKPLPARGRRIALVVLTSLLAVACTAEDDPAPVAASPGQSQSPKAGGEQGGGGDAQRKGGQSGGATAQEDSVELQGRGTDRTTSGRVPGYVSIEAAEVQGAVDALRLSVTLRGPIPERMPDAYTTLRVSFLIVTKDGKRFSFDAEGSDEGWAPTASGGDVGDFPGSLEISGPDAIMTVDPAYMGGLQPFQWLSSAAWVRNAPNGTSYGFDSLPKGGFAQYPQA